jgi:mono/diheme cytochrome c family protein
MKNLVLLGVFAVLALAGCGQESGSPSGTASSGGDGGSGSSSSGSGGGSAGGTTSAGGGSGVGTGTSSGSGSGSGSGGGGGSGSGAPAAYVAHCVSCHGDSAQGVTLSGPAIQRATREMTEYLVRNGDQNATVNGQNQIVGDPRTMTAFTAAMVSDAQIDEIVTWLQSFPAAATGAELFAQHCSFCHGVSGKGGATEYASAFHSAPFPTQTLASFTTYVKAGHTSENGLTVAPSQRRKYMPPFATLLTDNQLSLMFTWAKAQ